MRIFLLAVLVAGCGQDFTADTCDRQPSGLYQLTYTLRSGDCGAVNSSIIRLGNDVSATAPVGVSCMNFAPPTAAGSCEVQLETACMFQARPDLMMVVRGKVTWKPDVSSATGPVYVEMRGGDGLPLCRGQYQMSYGRI